MHACVVQERDAFLSQYPQGYHKTDKMVRMQSLGHLYRSFLVSQLPSQSWSRVTRKLYIGSLALAILQGRPIYIQHIGAIKIKQLAEVTTDDRMIRFHVQVAYLRGCMSSLCAAALLRLLLLSLNTDSASCRSTSAA